jgi:hypothetical protein
MWCRRQTRRRHLPISANYVGIKLEMLIYPAEDIVAAQDTDFIAPLSKKQPVFGCLEGQITIADDFDAPLEDFEKYV